MKLFELSQEEMRICIRGLVCLSKERDLNDDEQTLLSKLAILVEL